MLKKVALSDKKINIKIILKMLFRVLSVLYLTWIILKTMNSLNIASRSNKQISRSSIFKDCENALRLIKQGKITEAKSLFPLEFHLINKYFSNAQDQFKNILARKLEIK